jgi:hypothetical protein
LRPDAKGTAAARVGDVDGGRILDGDANIAGNAGGADTAIEDAIGVGSDSICGER